MPGLSIVCAIGRDVGAIVPPALRALGAVCHDATYRTSVLLHDPGCFIAASAYPDYPVASFDFGDAVVHLEGRLYGPTPPHAALRRLARTLFESGASDSQAADWVRETDGEFVVVAVHRATGRIAILNDMLGRLPLYGHQAGGTLILSRELRFIARLLPTIRYDRMGMAQFLLLGFPLGRRTLLDGVGRVAPASRIRIDPCDAAMHETQAPMLDLGRKHEVRRDTREHAHDLAQRFATACRARAATDGGNVVSLSGGADARSVAACLHRLAIPFRCATFLDAAGEAAADVEVAGRLATLFGSAWHLVRLRPPSRADELSLLRRKSGLNPLSMSYLLPYLAQVAQRDGGGIVFFTGDGGDKVLPDLSPTRPVGDADGAAAEVLRAHQICSLDEVDALTGVGRADLFMELRDRLASYPEERWADRHVHFEILERGFRWLFEGEDRNRGFFWSTTPFYATPFFLAAMQCDDAHKAHRGLYREFLRALSPPAAAVEYAGLGAGFDSDAFRIAAKAAALLTEHVRVRPEAMPRLAVDARRRGRATADRLRQQLSRCPTIAEHLRPNRLSAFVDGPAGARPRAADALYTLTSLIEDLTAGGETVDANRYARSGGRLVDRPGRVESMRDRE